MSYYKWKERIGYKNRPSCIQRGGVAVSNLIVEVRPQLRCSAWTLVIGLHIEDLDIQTIAPRVLTPRKHQVNAAMELGRSHHQIFRISIFGISGCIRISEMTANGFLHKECFQVDTRTPNLSRAGRWFSSNFLSTTIRQGTIFEIIGHVTTKSMALEFHPVQPLGRRKMCLSYNNQWIKKNV